MSDNETAKGKASSWTDRERLAYLVSVIDHADTKLSFKNAPLPTGRSLIACERMFARLKTHLKPELEALRRGVSMPGTGAGTSSTTGGTGSKAAQGAQKKTATPRKRKRTGEDVGEEEGEVGGSPVTKRRVRKGTGAPEGMEGDGQEDEEVKTEVKEEEEEEEEI